MYFLLHHAHQPQDCYLVGFAYLRWLSIWHIIHIQLRQAKTQQQHTMVVKQVHTFWLASPESFLAGLRLRTWRGRCTQSIKTTRRGRKRDTNLLGFSTHNRPQWLFWRRLGCTFSVHPFPHQSPGRLSAVQLVCAREVNSPRGLSFHNEELRKPLEPMKVEILH